VKSEPGQCIMKKRPGSEGRSCDGRSDCNGESGAKEPQKDIGKSAREWHFYLEGKDNRWQKYFPPRRQLESVIETKASSILQFLHGLREMHGTWVAWLYDLPQPQVQQIVVCNPRHNALLKEGSLCTAQRKLPNALRIVRESYGGQTLQGVTLTCFCSA
jgi:hypothetical protein